MATITEKRLAPGAKTEEVAFGAQFTTQLAKINEVVRDYNIRNAITIGEGAKREERLRIKMGIVDADVKRLQRLHLGSSSLGNANLKVRADMEYMYNKIREDNYSVTKEFRRTLDMLTDRTTQVFLDSYGMERGEVSIADYNELSEKFNVYREFIAKLAKNQHSVITEADILFEEVDSFIANRRIVRLFMHSGEDKITAIYHYNVGEPTMKFIKMVPGSWDFATQVIPQPKGNEA